MKTYPEYSTNYPLLLTTFMRRPVNLYPDRIGVVYRSPRSGQYFRFTWRQWFERTCRLANAPGRGEEDEIDKRDCFHFFSRPFPPVTRALRVL
ncbi:MAG: hypothetical protein HY787_08740 [Deltaproteobacteria bacterium]|nr:hypothetical protein [Deltaproteobacteria bacterium]